VAGNEDFALVSRTMRFWFACLIEMVGWIAAYILLAIVMFACTAPVRSARQWETPGRYCVYRGPIVIYHASCEYICAPGATSVCVRRGRPAVIDAT
jgi:hypothetical protein